MKASHLALLVGITLCLTGCVSYQYRVVQPAAAVPPVREQPVTIHYDPLDYRLYPYHDRLTMHVSNPTEDRIVLQGNRSFVVDPQGESHPIRDRVLGPHSYTQFLFPPIPFAYAYPDYWAYGPGWGWGWYGPWYGPGWYGPGWWGGWWGPPPVSYAQVTTPYDWTWKQGPARLKLTYERAGKTFEHDWEIVREPKKK
jgi:hypothetical protein